MTDGAAAPRVHLMQARDRDPLFEGAVYSYALDGSDSEIMVTVRVAPIFVSLLSLAARQRLRQLADDLVRGAAAELRDGDEIAVASDGTVRRNGVRLRQLL